ncbi:hypothetical protein ACO0LM_28755, partial [Undibacterium sp. Di26W]|uniref:hypothetical protein n=1 Tax=Undibacterium sp. Di26W TaxID=3413035 RepID=UPI003BF2BF18
MQRKHILCQIHANCRNIHFGLLASSSWSYFYFGTSMPSALESLSISSSLEGGVHTICSRSFLITPAARAK